MPNRNVILSNSAEKLSPQYFVILLQCFQAQGTAVNNSHAVFITFILFLGLFLQSV